MKSYLFIVLLLICQARVWAQHQLTIRILSAPKAYPTDTLYCAGNFNDWNPHKNPFVKDQQGYFCQIHQLPQGRLEYKITRGDWSKTETTASGSPLDNRVLLLSKDTSVNIRIEGWSDDHVMRPIQSTASPQVHILDTAFEMPSLSRVRRIWIYLPAEYRTTNKRYPVLYLHDGQNLFNKATSFSGEWGVDECLDTASFQFIVVGIDHGGDKRITEYIPFNFSLTDSIPVQSEGKQHAGFIATCLKPYIDKHFRTLTGREHSFIAGSSLGGLMAYYTLIHYPETFAAAGVFSPAFWVVRDSAQKDLYRQHIKKPMALYFMAGTRESNEMWNDIENVLKPLRTHQSVQLQVVKVSEGKHNEKLWREALPAFFDWLNKLRFTQDK